MICRENSKEIDILLKHKIKCVDCKKNLIRVERELFCSSCNRSYIQKNNGVWNFKSRKQVKTLDIYREKQFQKWQEVFRKQEVHQWSIYDTKFKRFFSQAGHRKIARMLRGGVSGKYLLEIGAGNGALLSHMPSNKYIGLDFSEESLEILKSKHESAVVISVDDTFIPFGTGCFENIVSLHTLEHIYPLGEHIQEIKRLLRINGIYSFVIPTEGGFSFWLGRQLVSGPNLKRKYGLDANYIMDREHINDAKRVLKFLRLYFENISKAYWPLKVTNLSVNAMIYGQCTKR